MRSFRPLSVLLAAMLFALPLAPALATSQTAAVPGNDLQELETAYARATNEFYKKVDPQMLLEGARAGMLAYLKKSGLKSADLPPIHAGDSPEQNVRTLDAEVEAAMRASGGKLSVRNVTYSAISGMMASLKDRWTVFLDPKEYAELNAGLDGAKFSGIGVVIDVDEKTKYLMVRQVIDGGPASKAGIQPGDLILSVNGKSTKGLPVEADSKMIRGKTGTSLKLEVQREGKSLGTLALTRAEIHAPSVYDRMLPGKIGYVALTVFGQDTATELTEALNTLQKDGARAYVLDLRNNGGGYLNAAIDVASKFIPDGPIVSVESRASNVMTYDAESTAIPPKPLAVLVNGYTASASEITSGAIQDSGVGVLIGTRTFGKGVVQTIYPLGDGSAIKITTARYFTPRGRDINHQGIEPDIVSKDVRNARFGDPAHDPQLDRAMAYLNQRLAAEAQQAAAAR
ncbi:MAG TPA: S41 family peptidase [Candidatus Dormibacteraeota bacterium]|nr:S41 family peptidase [Candidatus Dormibacteraeota bacterium]